MELSRLGNEIGNTVMEVGVTGGIGYLCTYAFTNINPWAGFVFGATYVSWSKLLDPVFQTEESTFASRVVGVAIKTAAAAYVALTAFGIEFNLASSISLGFSALVIPSAAAVAILLVVGSVLAVAAMLLTAKLLRNMG